MKLDWVLSNHVYGVFRGGEYVGQADTVLQAKRWYGEDVEVVPERELVMNEGRMEREVEV